VTDDEIRARPDGRARVDSPAGHLPPVRKRRIEAIAHALGYRLVATHNLGLAGIRVDCARDEAPDARHRAGTTIARLRAGGSLLPGTDAPPPPPPGPPRRRHRAP
jgi:hypothetical protein